MADDRQILETERLILRKLTPDDLEALFRLYRDPIIREHFPEGVLSRAETQAELDWIIKVYYGDYDYGLWATIYKPTGEFIGRCGLLPWVIDERQEVEVAYLLDRAYWRQGLATEAAQAIVAYGFDQLKFDRLICLPIPENAASIRVAEKMGMHLERELVLDGSPALLYSIAKS
ncbi:GNAT family N-acetyltransferase [Herpetosiphon gulosus]|uniref:Acetyltransferase PA3944 n=1 Tax=Herpetosiphon gulosus TaxID=1973496 RepID=A0ABP9WVC8_9CHLR